MGSVFRVWKPAAGGAARRPRESRGVRKARMGDLVNAASLPCGGKGWAPVIVKAMHIWQLLTVMAAAFVAGAINSIAGGGTLVSFPALLYTSDAADEEDSV